MIFKFFRLYDVLFKQFRDLFPSKYTAFIFVLYMILFINQGLLITSTKTIHNKYEYDPKLIVLLTEYVKLFVSLAIYFKNETTKKLFRECLLHKQVFVKYFVPAFLYCLYNNLQFINLANYDPTTYFILLQFRVVVTGLIYQLLFNKQLTRKQWISLSILTFGCIIKQAHPVSSTPNSSSHTKQGQQFAYLSTSAIPFLNTSSLGHPITGKTENFNIFDGIHVIFASIRFDKHLLFIMIQILCSCFAGVYNELLLKNKTQKKKQLLYNKGRQPQPSFSLQSSSAAFNEKPTTTTSVASDSNLAYKPLLENVELVIENVENGLITNTDKHQPLLPIVDTEICKTLQQPQPADTPIMIQNVFMYLDSIICNYFYIIAGVLLTHHPKLLLPPNYNSLTVPDDKGPQLLNSSNFSTSLESSNLKIEVGRQTPPNQLGVLETLFSDYRLILIVLNGAAIGIVTSFFLKHLNSILKNFASALEIIFTAILAKILLGIPAGGMYTVTASCLVFYSIWLYSRNPV